MLEKCLEGNDEEKVCDLGFGDDLKHNIKSTIHEKTVRLY